MMTLLVILFYVGAVVMAAVIIVGMMDTHMMPLSCPRCYHGSDDNIAGEHRPWFERYRGGTARCRWCGTYFKEHPNGSLVEDRD